MTYKDNIVVSVVMITYNHDQFIQEVTNGALMQKSFYDNNKLIDE
jgi:hypothetical protein